MERSEGRESAGALRAEAQNQTLPSDATSPPAQSAGSPPESRKPAEKTRRTKHTRVHKREKELFGLVTPIFLPLLDAGEPSPTTKKKEKKLRHREGKGESAGDSPPSAGLPPPSR